jgi:peptidyl-tRNA hydrolase
VRAGYRQIGRDGPETVIAAYKDGAADAELRRQNRQLAIVLAVAAVIAAAVAVTLEPGELTVASISPAPAQDAADPCTNQTWPHFSAACIASKSGQTR